MNDSGDGQPPRKGRWGALRHRDFRLLWLGETTSKLGSSMSIITMPLVAVAILDASTFQVSALAALTWLPWLLIGLPAGAWVDRMASRRVMLVCNMVSLVSFMSVPIAAWSGVLTIWQLMAAALVAGSAAVFFETAFQVYMPSLVPKEELVDGNAKLQGSASAAYIAGPGAGGLLAQAVGAVWGMAADALSFLVSTACLLGIRSEAGRKRPTGRSSKSLVRDIGEGLRYVFGDTYLRVFTLNGAAANLSLQGFNAVLVVFMVRELDVSPAAAGLTMAGTSLGGVLGAAAVPWVTRRFGSARGLLIAQATAPFGLLIPMAGSGAGLLLVVVGGLLISLGVVVVSVIKRSFVQEYCPRPMLGRVVVSMQFLNYGAIPVGALLGGGLSTVLGLRPTVWLMTGAFVLTTLMLLFSPVRRLRDLPGPSVEEADAGHQPVAP
ncbi:MFS transporter [Streptomyces anulatus]|uniref:MFS transporter n=1 Tax=Streptomyces anulatus TaxID=1892 RepID=UPI0022524073|nr:MFS transporter [Streptomyces anulatus]MCX4502497.1 MFS transporter [Streptomyces anulatus]